MFTLQKYPQGKLHVGYACEIIVSKGFRKHLFPVKFTNIETKLASVFFSFLNNVFKIKPIRWDKRYIFSKIIYTINWVPTRIW